MQNSNNQYRIRINFQIKAPQVRVVQSDGSAIGVMPTRDALQLAQSQGLDLIEINPKASPPVCKIIDYGKFKYDVPTTPITLAFDDLMMWMAVKFMCNACYSRQLPFHAFVHRPHSKLSNPPMPLYIIMATCERYHW